MKGLNEYLNSGILEMYVLGLTSEEENKGLQQMIHQYPELNAELDAITKALIFKAEVGVNPLNSTIKPMLLAVIDYTERLKNGEKPTTPPIISETSSISDYSVWLNREDMALQEDANEIEVKLINHKPKLMTAIVWIKHEAPYEIHTDVYEKFLVVEGSCDIVTDKGVHSLVSGQCLTLPLNLGHSVKVTSDIPCKVILQRVAA
jgi:mannose-6-phosphate isomerase-like protein (cupin superfamily)